MIRGLFLVVDDTRADRAEVDAEIEHVEEVRNRGLVVGGELVGAWANNPQDQDHITLMAVSCIVYRVSCIVYRVQIVILCI